MKEKILNHFGLRRIPFSKSISTKELFLTPSLKHLTERLTLAIDTEDFALISGTAGSGKSSAIRYFISELDSSAYPHVYITAENYKIGNIAKLILDGFKTEAPYNGYAALHKVKKAIMKMSSEKNVKPVIIIDEAQELPVTTLASIKNIANFQMDSKSRMTVILVGQNQLINKINMSELASLKRRIRIRYKFCPLTVENTVRYIVHQMEKAGATRSIFTEDTKNEVYRISNGIICNINNICYDLILAAVENSVDIIEPSLLETVLTGD
jgi:type II secretory pathway predicted ATPase ExeA